MIFLPLNMTGRVFFLSFPFLYIPVYLLAPIVSGANFLVIVVGDFCMGWESVFSFFWGQGTRELEGLYLRQNVCIYDLAALIDLE